MSNLRDLDTSDAPELNEGFKVVPPGEYQLYMDSSERKATNDGQSEKLECVFVVAAGEYENSKIWCSFNLWNKSVDATNIAKAQWRAICEATVGQPDAPNKDSASLHNKIFFALVDNVAAYDKATGKDHETKRKNEIVFRKGTIMSSKEWQAKQKAGQTAPAKTAETKTAEQPEQAQETKASPQPSVTPGKGLPPWKNKK